MIGIAVAVTLSAGCGSQSSLPRGYAEAVARQEAEDREANEKAAAAKAAADKAKATRAAVTAAEAPVKPPPAVSRPLPTADAALAVTADLPPPPAPPADLATWDEYDFHTARITAHPRLLDALQMRLQQPRRTEDEATMLAELLAPQSRGEVRDAAGKVTKKGEPAHPPAALATAVTAALGGNGTPPARETLARLLNGELPVENSKAALDGALTALLQQNTAANDELVIRAIVAPKPSLTAAAGVAPLSPLGQQALALARLHGSVECRVRLAQVLAAADMPREVAPPLLAMLREPDPRNVPAQVVLYQSPGTEAATRAALESQLAAIAAGEVERAFGFAAATGPARATCPAVIPAIWGDAFVDYLEVRQQGIANLPSNGTLIALSAAIPTDAARRRALRAIDRHWEDGPATLRTKGLVADFVADPGLILVVRAALRENGGTAATKPVRPPKGKPPVAPAAVKADPTAEWRKLVQELAVNYCRRCHATSLACDTAARRDGQPLDTTRANETQLPLPPHPDAAIAAWHRAAWPSPSSPAPREINTAPVELRYVRIEEKAKPSRLLGYYRRQLRGDELPLPDGIWLSGRGDCGPGRTREVDIFITRAKGGSMSALEDETQLTVEILTIEAADVELPVLKKGTGTSR